jgi:carotenoid 1,2-hydratase
VSSLAPLPDRPGSYRWYYVDFGADDVSAVAIFMIGSIFSPRYVANPLALPTAHCAVNFALYAGGKRRQWVLSEYSRVTQAERVLCIGQSRFRLDPDGSVEVQIRERLAPFGPETRAELRLRPTAPGLGAIPLVGDQSHLWEPRAPRCDAELRLPLLGRTLLGHGYVDANAGTLSLARTLPSWRWTRIHCRDRSAIQFWLPDGERLTVHASERRTTFTRERADPAALSSTRWGLRVPLTLRAGDLELAAPALVESSPFYARQLARTVDAHAMGEVADFRRFSSPLVRWMAHCRTRVERSPQTRA